MRKHLQTLFVFTFVCTFFFVSPLAHAEQGRLIAVDRATVYLWNGKTEWYPTPLHEFIQKMPDSGVTDSPGGRVRLTQDQRVERWVRGQWSDSGLRPPPPNLRYRNAIAGKDGGILVELANGDGFNYVLPDGQVIVSRLRRWQGEEAPHLRDLVPFQDGFLGIDSQQQVWNVRFGSESGNFSAVRAPQLGQASQLAHVNGTVALSPSNAGPIRIVRTLSQTEALPVIGLPPTAQLMTLDSDSYRQLGARLLDPAQVLAPRPAKKEEPILPRYGITFAQYQDLVKQKVGEVPGLEWIKKANSENKYRTLFGGGRLRGLLFWLDNELRANGYQATKSKTPPAIEQLALQADTDYDVVTLGTQDKQSIPGWDALSELFYRASVASGGPSIEKVFASDSEITDPYDALYDFAQGKLTFIKRTPRKFAEAARGEGGLWGNSLVAQSMRFLRFVKEFKNHTISERSVEFLKGLATSEHPGLVPSGIRNWWVHKGMLRLYGATGNNPAEFAKILKQNGLLELLTKKGIGTDSYEEFVPTDALTSADWSHYGFTLSDADILVRFFGRDDRRRTDIIRTALLLKQASDFSTPGEYLQTFEGNFDRGLIDWSFGNFDKFLSLKPAVDELIEAAKLLRQYRNLTSVKKIGPDTLLYALEALNPTISDQLKFVTTTGYPESEKTREALARIATKLKTPEEWQEFRKSVRAFTRDGLADRLIAERVAMHPELVEQIYQATKGTYARLSLLRRLDPNQVPAGAGPVIRACANVMNKILGVPAKLERP